MTHIYTHQVWQKAISNAVWSLANRITEKDTQRIVAFYSAATTKNRHEQMPQQWPSKSNGILIDMLEFTLFEITFFILWQRLICFKSVSANQQTRPLKITCIPQCWPKCSYYYYSAKIPPLANSFKIDVSQQWSWLNHESGSSYLPGDNELSPAAAPPTHVHWGHFRNWMYRKQETETSSFNCNLIVITCILFRFSEWGIYRLLHR